MTSFFGFASAPVEVEIRLNGESDRKQVEVKGDHDKKELCPVYYDGESVEGKVSESCGDTPLTTGYRAREGREKVPA